MCVYRADGCVACALLLHQSLVPERYICRSSSIAAYISCVFVDNMLRAASRVCSRRWYRRFYRRCCARGQGFRSSLELILQWRIYISYLHRVFISKCIISKTRIWSFRVENNKRLATKNPRLIYSSLHYNYFSFYNFLVACYSACSCFFALRNIIRSGNYIKISTRTSISIRHKE